MPQTVKVPLHTPTYVALDSKECTDSLWKATNAIFLQNGILTRRPAFQVAPSFVSLGACRSLTQGYKKEVLSTYTGLALFGYKTTDGSVFRVVRTASDTYEVVTLAETVYADQSGFSYVNELPNLTYDRTNYYVAKTTATGKIGSFTASTALAALTDADAPTGCSKVDFLDTYILAQKSPYIYFSDVDTGTSWNTLNLFQPSSDPDDLVTFIVFDRLIYLFGRKTTEVWANDGVTPFSRISQGVIDEGILHPRALTVANKSLYFMNTKSQLMRIRGTQAELIPGAIQERFSLIGNYSYINLNTLYFRGREYVAVSQNGTTTVYDPSGDLTYYWSVGPLTDTGEEATPTQGLVIDSSILNPSISTGRFRNLLSITSPFDAISVVMDYDSIQVDNNGQTAISIPFDVRTGHISYNTTKLKRSNEFRMYLSRPNTTSTGYKLELTLVDDIVNTQGPYEFNVQFGVNENEAVVRLPRTGMFKTRQYKLSSTDDVPIRLIKAEEDIDVLRS